MRRILLIFILLLTGCHNNVQTKSSNSLTYNFFKDFNASHYYVSFFDRNVTINDDAKIIMARDDDKFYYEMDGDEKVIIIQKEGYIYNLDVRNKSFSKKEGPFDDYSSDILPSDIEELKKSKYKTGREKVFNSYYVFERFKNSNSTTTYYYKGSSLKYIRYNSPERSGLLKFSHMKDNFDLNIFGKYEKFNEITY